MLTRLMVGGGGVMGRRRFRTRGRCNSGNRCSGHGDANRYRTRGDSGGSARARGSARTGSSAACGRTTARGALSLSKHLKRNRKRYNKQECNANRVFSEFPHDPLPPSLKDIK